MKLQTVQLHRNLPPLLQRFGLEELYTVAQCLSNELARRSLDAHQEGRALELALLVLAREEHRLLLSVQDEAVGPAPADWQDFWTSSALG